MFTFNLLKYFTQDFLFIIVLICKCNNTVSSEPIVITTTTGAISGNNFQILDRKIMTFLGIPYAKPPLGNKRFTKSEPIDKWEGVLSAKYMPPACMQLSSKTEFPWVPPLNANRSEDCLYLNMWVPINDSIQKSEKLPVLVWVYGGYWYTGSINMDLYDGGVMASIGQIIVVTVNYRVGSFGFLYAGSNEAPGNVGFHDSLLALKWIKNNVENFGGNPNKITLCGESAGAMNIGSYLLMPSAQSLFNQAIMESGSPYLFFLFEPHVSALSRTHRFAKAAGCAKKGSNMKNNYSDLIICLKKKDARELAELENKFTQRNFLNFQPSQGYKDDSANIVFRELTSRSRITKPILIGTNKDELTLFLEYFVPEILSLKREQPSKILAQVSEDLNNIFNMLMLSKFSNLISNFTNEFTDKVLQSVASVPNDLLMHCPALYFAEETETAYFYWMNYRSSKDEFASWVGDYHSGEIQYIFGRPFVNTSKYTSEDREFSFTLIQKWASFARDGHPFGKSDEKRRLWPKFSLNHQVYKLNPRDRSISSHPRRAHCEFWKPFLVAAMRLKALQVDHFQI